MDKEKRVIVVSCKNCLKNYLIKHKKEKQFCSKDCQSTYSLIYKEYIK